ncbi:low temperature requirement A protein (LtrA) [Micromonospora palomenae]|uniref:Low temperature requirement A protein (LtrA) n=2 Tax=Micromonospora palomenae TaxID=1461247 RepID=A0A561WFJ7_9ACTN|nr:low temperature requirement A protein (LtrA) [Micromonospora palomenae]
MMAGIVATAVGRELVIDHPFDHAEPAWLGVILGGPALFLIGRSLFEYVEFSRVSRSRLIGLLALVAGAPALAAAPPLGAAIAAAAVLVLIAGADAARARGRPPEPPSPAH